MSKRILSLVLAMVMVLGTFGTVFAANTVTTEAEAGAFLKAAGVLNGDENGNLNLGNNLSRQDAVILVAQLRGEIEAAKNFSKLPTYEDVKIKFYNAPLAWAQDNGLFVGHSDKVFGFGENLTAQQYSRVLFEALGYKVDTTDASDIKYSVVFDKANEEGILKGLELTQTTEITRGQMALMTFNALGVTMKDSKKTLAETLGIEMPEAPAAKELTAEVNDTENLKEVVLELSNAKLVDEDKLVNTNNYKVVDNNVVKATVEGDNVIILLEKALLDGREYKLRVRSIDKAINKEYKFIARDNTIPKVEEVVVLGEYGIKVITNEPIDIYEGTDRGRNFVVDGKNVAMNVESYGRETVLTPYSKETFKDAKTLTITGLTDFAGFKTGKENFDLEVVKDEVAPKVEDVILRGDKIVEVVFDKDVYVDSVEAYYDRSNVGNISYLSGRHTIFADEATKIDTNKVRYEFKEEFLRTRTDFTIVDVTNHSKVAMEKTTMVAREILDNVEPEIIEKKIEVTDFAAGKAKITLRFDKDVTGILEKDSDVKFDYTKHVGLYERDVLRRNDVSKDHVDAVKYLVKDNGDIVKDTIVVELRGLKEWKTRNTDRDNYYENEMDYVLEVERFASGRNEMYRDYYEFKFRQSTGFSVKEVTVDERKYETHVTMEFTKKVDRNIAEDETNYIFTNTKNARKDVKDLKGRIVTEKNGYEVTIIIPDFKVADYKELRILDVLKDIDGNRLNTETVYNFVAGTISNNANYTMVKNDNGEFEITPKTDVKEITLKTDAKGKFIIMKDLNKLTINAPNADVEIKQGVDVEEVVIEAIKSETLFIEGTVKQLVLSTDKLVTIKGTVTGMKITPNKDLTVKINDEESKLNKDVLVVVVSEDGKVDKVDAKANLAKAVANVKDAVEVGVSVELKVTTGVAIELKDVKAKLEEKLTVEAGEDYKVTAEDFKLVSKELAVGENVVSAVLVVKEAKGTESDKLIKETIIVTITAAKAEK